MRCPALCLSLLFVATGVSALQSQQGAVTVTPVVSGLDTPWGIGLTSEGGLLITEKDGRILLVQDGGVTEVSGAPKVDDAGQGGLLDVTIARDFATTREVFLTYSKPQRGGAGTALAVARLSDDGTALENVRDIFESAPGFGGGRHFGSRVIEADDGTLYVTIGDRGDRPSAQDRANHNGSIIRVNRDGSIPEDNPFVGQSDILPEIWSFGHRNPQGADFDANGTIWTAEHGARGGDEVNRVQKGANFGWPVISYGRHYSGLKIGEGTEKDGMEQPAHYWDPSIAPSGLLVYQGDMFPDWKGDLLVGSLKFDYISRLAVSGDSVTETEQLKSNETSRVRDIIEAPDGAIWFISVGEGTVYRMSSD